MTHVAPPGRYLAPILLLLPLLTAAGPPPVAVLRVESVAALEADAARIESSGLAANPIDTLLQQVGLPHGDWIDPRRPLALALPQQGMMLGAKALIAVLPARDPAAAVARLAGEFAAHETHAEGVHRLTRADGTELELVARDGYIVVAAGRGLVAAFDARSALDVAGLPAGNLGLHLDLAAVRPMLLGGLGLARGLAEQQIAAAGTDAQPQAESLGPLLGLYVDLATDLVNNTDTVALSVEVGETHLVLHKRLTPRAGSTLAGLVQAQHGELPRLARYLDGTDATLAMAGQIRYTPAFLAAARGFMTGYGKALGSLAEASRTAPGSEPTALVLQAIAAQGDRWLDCYRGDFATVFHVATEGGLRVTQVMGTTDPATCRALTGELARALGDGLVSGDSAPGAPSVSTVEDALVYRGVHAMRQEVRIALPEERVADPGAQALISTWLDDGRLVSFVGVRDALMLSTTGRESESEAEFRKLVDRVADGRAAPGALAAERFAPLAIGPGLFVRYDIGALIDAMHGALSSAAPELPPIRGALVYGARFDDAGLVVELAAPLEMLRTLGSARGGGSSVAAPRD